MFQPVIPLKEQHFVNLAGHGRVGHLVLAKKSNRRTEFCDTNCLVRGADLVEPWIGVVLDSQSIDAGMSMLTGRSCGLDHKFGKCQQLQTHV